MCSDIDTTSSAKMNIFHLFLGEFMCCGGYSFNLGYQDWKHTMLGGQFNSVPDSCCLKQSNQCGKGVFRITDARRLVEQINTHGCITVMQRRLEDHVIVGLLTFTKGKSSLEICLLTGCEIVTKYINNCI